MKSTLSTLLAVALLASCSPASTTTDNVIVMTDKAEKVDCRDMADFIEIVDAIALPSSDSLVISSVTDIKRRGESLYLLCCNNDFGMNGVVMEFGADGTYKRQLTRIGNGPGELSPFSIINFDVDDHGLFVSDSRGINHYDLDGNYLGKLLGNLQIDGFKLVGDRIVTLQPKDSMLCHAYDMEGKEIASAMPNNTLGSVGSAQPWKMLADDRVVFNAAGTNDGVAFNPADDSFSTVAMTLIPDVQTVEDYEKTVKLNPDFGTMEGEYTGEIINLLTISGDDMIMNTFREGGSDARMWFSDNSAVRVMSYDGDINDTATGGSVLFPAGFPMDDGVWVSAVSAERLLEAAEKSPVASKLSDILPELGAEDNPVLVFYRLK